MWHQGGAVIIQSFDWIETSTVVLAVGRKLRWGCQLVPEFSFHVAWTFQNIELGSKKAEVTDLFKA